MAIGSGICSPALLCRAEIAFLDLLAIIILRKKPVLGSPSWTQEIRDFCLKNDSSAAQYFTHIHEKSFSFIINSSVGVSSKEPAHPLIQLLILHPLYNISITSRTQNFQWRLQSLKPLPHFLHKTSVYIWQPGSLHRSKNSPCFIQWSKNLKGFGNRTSSNTGFDDTGAMIWYTRSQNFQATLWERNLQVSSAKILSSFLRIGLAICLLNVPGKKNKMIKKI